MAAEPHAIKTKRYETLRGSSYPGRTSPLSPEPRVYRTFCGDNELTSLIRR